MRIRGRSRHNKTVNFDGTAAAGETVEVEIVDATSTTLSGFELLSARLEQRA
jgi:tRNA-2-methylthio-N6-dimethylallyladenosine synthase